MLQLIEEVIFCIWYLIFVMFDVNLKDNLQLLSDYLRSIQLLYNVLNRIVET